MQNKDKLIGSIAALIPNIIFGFSFLFSKIALSYSHPLVMVAIRFTVAFLVLNILWGLRLIKLNFRGKDLKKLFLMALVQPLLYFIFESYGISQTSSAISGVIISLSPICVIFISLLFLKEKPTRRQILFSLVSLASVAAISILSNDGKTSTPLGIVLLFFAALCGALYTILSRSEAENFTPVERTYMMFLFGAVGFNIIAFLALRKEAISEYTRAASSIEFWGAMLYLAILSSIVAFMLMNYATSKIDAVLVSSFSNLITVVSVLAGIFIMKENLSALQLFFCAMIIVGVYGANYQKQNSN